MLLSNVWYLCEDYLRPPLAFTLHDKWVLHTEVVSSTTTKRIRTFKGTNCIFWYILILYIDQKKPGLHIWVILGK